MSPHMSLNTFQDAQQHLLRILSHHMICIAERVSSLDHLQNKTLLIEDAHSQWNRKANFEWMEISGVRGSRLDASVSPIPSSVALTAPRKKELESKSLAIVDPLHVEGPGTCALGRYEGTLSGL